MTYKQLSAAGTTPVTRDEVKTWLKIDGTAEDALLDGINVAAT
jgi:hypothetical protein